MSGTFRKKEGKPPWGPDPNFGNQIRGFFLPCLELLEPWKKEKTEGLQGALDGRKPNRRVWNFTSPAEGRSEPTLGPGSHRLRPPPAQAEPSDPEPSVREIQTAPGSSYRSPSALVPFLFWGVPLLKWATEKKGTLILTSHWRTYLPSGALVSFLSGRVPL